MNITTIKRSWPASERPRERLLGLGPSVMTDAELLALVLGASTRGSGGVLQTSRDLIHRFNGLDGLGRCQPGELMQVPGIGEARACAVTAVMELARRLATGPALAIRGTKHALNRRVWNDINQALDLGLALEERSARHPDHPEAARAFVEKRAPQYKGTI